MTRTERIVLDVTYDPVGCDPAEWWDWARPETFDWTDCTVTFVRSESLGATLAEIAAAGGALIIGGDAS